jgi:transcriptional antiterminator RfaH
MFNWYLIHTKVRAENIAKINLENQGFTTYCPQFIFNNKKQTLFPRYIFVKVNENQDIHPIKSTTGVVNIVSFGNNFAKVSQQIIDNIQKNEDLIKDKITQDKILKSGDKVEILTGVFAGNSAIFNEYNGEKRVVLLLKLLGQEQQIILDKEQIKRF